MPPVSLPLNGGTQSAFAGPHATMAEKATRLAARIIRIRKNSFWVQLTLERIARHEKNASPCCNVVAAKCCRVALDFVRASRHGSALVPLAESHARPFRIVETQTLERRTLESQILERKKHRGRAWNSARAAWFRASLRSCQSPGDEFLAFRPAI